MQMTRRFDLITFDLDGTMLDDEWAHGEANRRMGQRLGIDHTQLGPMTGYSVRMRWQELCRCTGRDLDVEQLAEEHFRLTLEVIKEAGIPEAPGLTATLRALKEDGYSIAVVSSSDEWFVREGTDLLGLTSYLDFFVTQNQVLRLKPDPESYLTAQRLAGVPAHRALGIEDSTPGCQALRRAGMYSVGFLNGGKNTQALEDTDATIDQMEELLSLL